MFRTSAAGPGGNGTILACERCRWAPLERFAFRYGFNRNGTRATPSGHTAAVALTLAGFGPRVPRWSMCSAGRMPRSRWRGGSALDGVLEELEEYGETNDTVDRDRQAHPEDRTAEDHPPHRGKASRGGAHGNDNRDRASRSGRHDRGGGGARADRRADCRARLLPVPRATQGSGGPLDDWLQAERELRNGSESAQESAPQESAP